MLDFIVFKPGYQSLILLFIIIQELVFSFILLRKSIREDSPSDRWLSLLVFLCAMYLTPWMFGHANWYAKDGYRDFLFFVPFHQYFLFGPIMYFLTLSLAGGHTKLNKRDWVHFVPGGVYLIYSAIVAIVDLLILDEYYFYADGLDKDFEPWYQTLGLASMVIYAILSLQKYADYKKRIYETVSFADSVKLRWLRDFLATLIVLIILRGIFTLLFVEDGDYNFRWYYYLIFGILSYYLSTSGLLSSFRLSALGFLGIQLFELEVPTRDRKEDENLEQVMQRVSKLFDDERLFKDPNLTLAGLAKNLETNTSILSRSINEKSDYNFNDFVNSYRIAAVKEAIANGDTSYMTLTGIALDAGFNSKSTFIRSFKKLEGMTPTEYLNAQNKSGVKS